MMEWWKNSGSVVLNFIYIVLSGYIAAYPVELAWLAPIVTGLAVLTRTPQSAVLGSRSEGLVEDPNKINKK